MSNSYRNGETVASDIATDRALLYGDGVFTTIVIKDQKALFIEEHFKRLLDNCQQLKIINLPLDEIKISFSSAIEHIKQGIVRITVARSSGERGYFCANPKPVFWITSSDWPVHIQLFRASGINVRYCEQRLSQNPSLAGIKHCNRLEQVLARNEWQSDDYQEGLMLDTQGHLIEGTMSNLFIIKNNLLITPTLTLSGVKGIMRQKVIEIAQSEGIEVNIMDIKPEDLKSAEAAFVTNSVIGIWSINKIENHSFTKNPLIEKLQQSLHKFI
ncbi:MAG: 4-amino-4-deoxychorismate lyase [Enterobacterales bacterium]